MLEELIVEVIGADAGMVATFGDRVHPMSLPRRYELKKGSTDLPALTYSMVSEPTHPEVPVTHPRYRFTIFADKYSTAKQAAQKIKDLFNGLKYKGIRCAASVNSQDMNDPDTGLYMLPVDVKFTYMKEEV